MRATRNSSLFLALVVLAIIGTTQTACTGCRTAADPTPTERLEQALKRRDALTPAQAPANSSPAAGPTLKCPPLNASMVPTTPPASGGHRVTLTWKASAPADSKHAAAAGYCIYRGAPGDPNPGLMNSIPLRGTSCIDELVANGGRYSYVVRAISAGGSTSITSNPAPVEIPPTGSSKSPVSAASPPLCRGAASAK
ncbi:MAG: hypothetical protein WBQ08_00545 [Candidatus Sulfotelmatobacter sp.]